MSGPIKPAEVTSAKAEAFPQVVYEVVNDLIQRNMSKDKATVFQEDIIAALGRRGYTRERIFKLKLLDFEEVYEAAGWKVEYDKPGWNETYAAVFRFKK